MRKFLTALFALAFSVSSAFAGGTISLMGIGPAANIVLPSIVYNGTASVTTASTTNSTTVNTGTAATGRLVVVAVGCRAVLNGSISSGTINGGAALVRATAGAGSNAPRSASAILAAVVASGTTVSVSVSGAQNFQGCVFASYSLYDLNSSSAVNSCGSTTSCAVTTSAGGFAIGVGGTYQGTCSMSPAQDYSVVLGGSFGTACGGEETTTGSNSTWTATFSDGTSRSVTAASWR